MSGIVPVIWRTCPLYHIGHYSQGNDPCRIIPICQINTRFADISSKVLQGQTYVSDQGAWVRPLRKIYGVIRQNSYKY
jgi:hypothetical protein